MRPVLLAVLLLLAGPGRAQPHPPGHGTPPPTPGAAQSGAAADQALMATMDDMNKGMAAAAMTGDPDGDFVRMMIAHHRGAVAMARVQLEHGRDPGMKALARRVVADQEREIGEMSAWLKAHPGR